MGSKQLKLVCDYSTNTFANSLLQVTATSSCYVHISPAVAGSSVILWRCWAMLVKYWIYVTRTDNLYFQIWNLCKCYAPVYIFVCTRLFQECWGTWTNGCVRNLDRPKSFYMYRMYVLAVSEQRIIYTLNLNICLKLLVTLF